MIDIYFADVTALNSEDVYNKYLKTVSDYRREKIDRYVKRKDKILSLGVSVLIDIGLKKYRLNEKNAEYVLGINGKPYFKDGNLFFNVSHSCDMAMAVFSDKEIGCDIEKIRDINLNLSKRYFTEKEYNGIVSAETDKEKKEIFFDIWTLKESYIKYSGKGLSENLKGLESKINGEEVLFFGEKGLIDCSSKRFFVKDGYKSAVCTRSKEQAEIKYINL